MSKAKTRKTGATLLGSPCAGVRVNAGIATHYDYSRGEPKALLVPAIELIFQYHNSDTAVTISLANAERLRADLMVSIGLAGELEVKAKANI